MRVTESLELKVLSMFMWQSHGKGFMIEDGDCFVPRNDVLKEFREIASCLAMTSPQSFGRLLRVSQ